ncbi:MAG: chorismate mutase [Halobacteriota archaeon]
MEEPTGNDDGAEDRQPGSLDDLRRDIEDVDAEIVDAVARRCLIAEDIAAVKRERGIEIEDGDREREVVERAVERGRAHGLDEEQVRRLYEVLIEMSKRRQRGN